MIGLETQRQVFQPSAEEVLGPIGDSVEPVEESMIQVIVIKSSELLDVYLFVFVQTMFVEDLMHVVLRNLEHHLAKLVEMRAIDFPILIYVEQLKQKFCFLLLSV